MQKKIELLEELVKTYEAHPNDCDERDYYLWDKRIRELTKQLASLPKEQSVTDGELFEAWKAGEINGKNNLSAFVKLDIEGSRLDFNGWRDGLIKK